MFILSWFETQITWTIHFRLFCINLSETCSIFLVLIIPIKIDDFRPVIANSKHQPLFSVVLRKVSAHFQSFKGTVAFNQFLFLIHLCQFPQVLLVVVDSGCVSLFCFRYMEGNDWQHQRTKSSTSRQRQVPCLAYFGQSSLYNQDLQVRLATLGIMGKNQDGSF